MQIGDVVQIAKPSGILFRGIVTRYTGRSAAIVGADGALESVIVKPAKSACRTWVAFCAQKTWVLVLGWMRCASVPSQLILYNGESSRE
jgi:hypothetical protein